MENLDFREDFLRIGSHDIYKKGTSNVKNLRILNTGNKYGCMNTKVSCYPEGMSSEKRQIEFLKHRALLAIDNDFAFNPYKFYMPSQNKEGKAVELTKDMIDTYEDGWDLDIPGDILVVTDKTPGVVVGFPVADCPVVVASDLKNGVTATAHCSAEMIDNYLPKMTIEALQSGYNSKLDDIYVYIGAHAGNSWSYDTWPRWAKEGFWEETGAIRFDEADEKYKIDLRKAMLSQLNPEVFNTFIINNDDTITNPNYYSNSASRTDKAKDGRHFEGAYYQKIKKM